MIIFGSLPDWKAVAAVETGLIICGPAPFLRYSSVTVGISGGSILQEWTAGYVTDRYSAKSVLRAVPQISIWLRAIIENSRLQGRGAAFPGTYLTGRPLFMHSTKQLRGAARIPTEFQPWPRAVFPGNLYTISG
ncbi:MAG: hypothetical protein ACXIU7_09530 [Roseinatronobacter sp.]